METPKYVRNSVKRTQYCVIIKRVKYWCSVFVTLYVQLDTEVVMKREFKVQQGKQDRISSDKRG